MKTTTDLWEHQQKAVDFAVRKMEQGYPGVLWSMGMRTGKTLTAFRLMERIGARRALVLAPPKALDVWEEQAQIHTDGDTLVTALRGTSREQAYRAASIMEHAADHVLVVPYTTVWREPLREVLHKLAPAFDLLILDESHRVKTPNSKTSRAALYIGNLIPHRVALSGKPLPNSILDAWAQFRIIAPGVFPRTYTEFRNNYAVMDPRYPGRVYYYKSENAADFSERYGRVVLEVSRGVLKLTESTHTEVRVDLPPKAKRVYEDLKKTLVSELESGELITVPSAMDKIGRLQQMANGFVYLDAGAVRIHTEKQEALQEFLEDLEDWEKVVVFYRYREDGIMASLAAEAAERRIYWLNGEHNHIGLWRDYPSGAVLLSQIQAGSEAVNLSAARHCVFYSPDFSVSNFEQAKARIHGPDQTRPVHYTYIVTRGTVDRQIYRSLETKADIIRQFVAGKLDLDAPEELTG